MNLDYSLPHCAALSKPFSLPVRALVREMGVNGPSLDLPKEYTREVHASEW